MAHVEDEYHKKTLGIFPASEKKIAKGVEAAERYASSNLEQDAHDKQQRLQREENEAKKVEEGKAIQILEQKIKDAEVQYEIAKANDKDSQKRGDSEERRKFYLNRVDETAGRVNKAKQELEDFKETSVWYKPTNK
jgi:hypothetical protein